MPKMSLVGVSEIQTMIIELRGYKVILDRYLAMLYGVSTRRLIQAIKRNRERFSNDFMFQLNTSEADSLVSQNVIPHRKYFGGRNPYAFTRNGANMVSTVLKSPIAIQRSIQIMRAFSTLEVIMGKKKKILTNSPDVIKKLSTHSKAIMCLFQESKMNRKGIAKVKKIQREMIDLFQQMVIASMGKGE